MIADTHRQSGDLPLFRATDPATSRAAAASIALHLTELQGQVLDALRACPDGATGAELERLPRFAHCAPSTVRKRLTDLHRLGLAQRTGAIREGCAIYEVTP